MCITYKRPRVWLCEMVFSSLKKLQRLESDLPGLFPKVLNVSYDDGEAYFDLEYLSNHKNLFEILTDKKLSLNEVEKIHHAFVTGLSTIT